MQRLWFAVKGFFPRNNLHLRWRDYQVKVTNVTNVTNVTHITNDGGVVKVQTVNVVQETSIIPYETPSSWWEILVGLGAIVSGAGAGWELWKRKDKKETVLAIENKPDRDAERKKNEAELAKIASDTKKNEAETKNQEAQQKYYEAKTQKLTEPKDRGCTISNIFDGFVEHVDSIGMSSISLTVGWISLCVKMLYDMKDPIKEAFGKIKVNKIGDIATLYPFFNTGTIELTGRKGGRIFGSYLTIFIYLVILNLTGLLLYAVTVKSQLSTTFWFSITVVLSCILLGIKNKGLEFFSMFWNTGVEIVMRVLLLFVEVLSFCIRPVSYALRLFANLLSGHILLHLFAKVINVLRKKNKLLATTGPFTFLTTFGVLETLIAGLQSFIPATLFQIWSFETF